jgi:hypothetical protein
MAQEPREKAYPFSAFSRALAWEKVAEGRMRASWLQALNQKLKALRGLLEQPAIDQAFGDLK